MTCRLPARTLHLTNAYHPTSGGIRTFYRALLDGAEARSRAMHLVVPAERTETEWIGRTCAIHHVRAAPAPGFDRRYRLLTPRHYLGAAAPVRRLLAELRPDVVEVCDKYTLVAAAWLIRRGGPRRPRLVGFSCERMDDNVAAYLTAHPVAGAMSRHYLRCVYVPAFDRHLANSAYTAQELLAAGAAAGRVGQCGMGVDVDTFAAARRDESLRRRLLHSAGGTAAATLALYAGRLSPEKSLDTLIDAVALLDREHRAGGPDVRLVLIGDGPALPRLASLAKERGAGRIAFLPHVADRSHLAAHYGAADVFVHPNPREPFGIGPLEAMAAGTPVVVSDAGGVRAYADAGNAWLATPGAAGLAAAMVRALGAGRSDARIACARETARAHAWPRAIDRYFATIDDVHAERSGAVASRVATGWRHAVPGR